MTDTWNRDHPVMRHKHNRYAIHAGNSIGPVHIRGDFDGIVELIFCRISYFN